MTERETLDAATTAALQDFIRDATEVAEVPLVPKIKLHLARAAKPLIAAAGAQLSDLELGGHLEQPYWAFAWTAGQGLARFLLDHPAVVAGRRVMDFGCGSGQVAIAAKLAGAAEVAAYDLDPVACVAARMNAALKGTEVTVRHEDPVPGPLGAFEVILAGDVFTSAEQVARLLPWFAFQAASGSDLLFADPERDDFPEVAGRRLAEHRVHNPFEPNLDGEKFAYVFRVPPLEMTAGKPSSDEATNADAAPGDEPLDDELAREMVTAACRVSRHPLDPALRLYMAGNTIRLKRQLAEHHAGPLADPNAWAFPWACGQALVQRILEAPETLRGRRVLVPDCGNGQVAIAAARAGAAMVQATDGDPLACAATAMNAALNGVQVTVSRGEALDAVPEACDLILAADPFRGEAAAGALQAWLQHQAAAGIEVLVADNGRPGFQAVAFEHLGACSLEPHFALLDLDAGEVGFWRPLEKLPPLLNS